MVREIVVILPGTRKTSRNIKANIEDLSVDIKMIPIIDVKVDYGAVGEAYEKFSSESSIDLSIFTSKTAVRIVRELIPRAWRWAKVRSVAIGPGTASLLNSLGVENVDVPSEHSSNGLIEFLKGVPNNTSITLYCSMHVNPSLEEFVRSFFNHNYIFKLYSINKLIDRVDNIVKLVKSKPSKRFLVILTSLQILRILLEDGRLQHLKNVSFSAISRRIADEAERLGFPISHNPQKCRIDEYYADLRNYLKNLLNSQPSTL
ncbi:MAG: uroporphyrinogen-III synthase [Candidatus Caldarchaeales archaeon]